jgi:hypothetical protein
VLALECRCSPSALQVEDPGEEPPPAPHSELGLERTGKAPLQEFSEASSNRATVAVPALEQSVINVCLSVCLNICMYVFMYSQASIIGPPISETLLLLKRLLGGAILQPLVKMFPLPKRFYYLYGFPATEDVSVIDV